METLALKFGGPLQPRRNGDAKLMKKTPRDYFDPITFRGGPVEKSERLYILRNVLGMGVSDEFDGQTRVRESDGGSGRGRGRGRGRGSERVSEGGGRGHGRGRGRGRGRGSCGEVRSTSGVKNIRTASQRTTTMSDSDVSFDEDDEEDDDDDESAPLNDGDDRSVCSTSSSSSSDLDDNDSNHQKCNSAERRRSLPNKNSMEVDENGKDGDDGRYDVVSIGTGTYWPRCHHHACIADLLPSCC